MSSRACAHMLHANNNIISSLPFIEIDCKGTANFWNMQIYVPKNDKNTEIFAHIIFFSYLCSRICKILTTMENQKDERREAEIVYSRSVKAGKRIYYLDVRKARNEDLYLCITESKRRQSEGEEAPSFEKHKLFLYKEDFAHFTEGLQDVIGYVKSQIGDIEARTEWTPEEKEEQAEPAAEEEPKKKGLFGMFK